MAHRARRATAVLMLLAAAGTARADDVLLGRVDPETILAIAPEWRSNHDAFEPADSDIRRIASSPVEARRIVEKPQTSLEHDLADLLERAASLDAPAGGVRPAARAPRSAPASGTGCPA